MRCFIFLIHGGMIDARLAAANKRKEVGMLQHKNFLTFK